jgi:hypothetical protein
MEICEIQSHLLVHNITTKEDWVLQRLLTLDKAMMQFPKFQGPYMMDRLPMRRLMNERKGMLYIPQGSCHKNCNMYILQVFFLCNGYFDCIAPRDWLF